MSSRTALLLIDVQQDFLARPELFPPRDRLVRSLANLLGVARAAGWPVVHVRTRAAVDGSNWMPHWRRNGSAPCLEGSPGAEPPEGLEEKLGEPVFSKTHFSAFSNPELAPFLRSAGIERLVIAGAHTHACIRSSVTDAYALGFEILLPEEGLGSYDPDHGEQALGWMVGRAARRISLRDLAVAEDLPAFFERQEIWEHRNPSDQADLIGEVPLASLAEISAAVETVREQQRAWASAPIVDRAARLRAWLEQLAAQQETWIQLLIRDVGKPRTDAEGEVAYGLSLLGHLYASLCDEESDGQREVRYRPIGTVGLITPWNNPFAIPISKIAPALAYGNCAVWKPALPGTGIARALLRSLKLAGLASFINIVPGDATTGRLLAEAGGMDAIAFTGSVAAGRQLASLCGRLGRPLQAELGGNNGAIVLADADLEAAAADLAAAMFSFAGQRCTAIRRVIVERSIFELFAVAIGASVGALRVGSPETTDTHMGPVISMEVRDRLLGEVGAAVEAGARVIAGGGIPEGLDPEGCWIEPTVLTDLTDESPILTRELFGPVVALIPADDLGQAIRIHNRVEQGLLGAIYTEDPDAQALFLKEAEAGLLSINRARPAFSAAGPFSGWKASGYGLPEHGRWNRDFYTRVQAVYR